MNMNHALFETPIGICGIVWSDVGIAGVLLPDARADRLRAALPRRFPDAREGAPPPGARRAMARIAAHLGGARTDYGDLTLDRRGVGEFEARVHAFASAIPPGETRTYGEVAAALGDPALARAVGQALGRNPWPIVVPCHRVTGADGRAGGFSAPGGAATKLRLLEIEGALSVDSLPLFAARS